MGAWHFPVVRPPKVGMSSNRAHVKLTQSDQSAGPTVWNFEDIQPLLDSKVRIGWTPVADEGFRNHQDASVAILIVSDVSG